MNPAEFANIARAEADFWWYRGMRQIMFRLLDPIAASRRFHRVLDAGCGTGHFAQVLTSRYGFPIVAADVQPEGLRRARQIAPLVALAQADILALPFASNRFDMVISMDVMVHFPAGREQKAMSELARVLEPGGYLVIRVAALDILRSRHSQFTCERQRFTRKRLLDLAASHRIQPLRCTYTNSLLLPLAFTKFRILEPLLRQPPASGMQPVARWLDRALFKALDLESRWIGAGRNFCLGQSLILIGIKT